jgi:hypothetical protein
MFLTKDLVAVFFGVFHLMFSWSVVANIRIVVKKPCGGWLDDAWSGSLPNFVFQVSSRINTGPVLHGNTAHGIACPWSSTPWAKFCW